MAMKTKHARLAHLAPSTCAIAAQGSYESRTKIYAYIHASHHWLEETAKHCDADIVWMDNLHRVIGAAEAKSTELKPNCSVRYLLFCIDHHLQETDKAALSGLVMNDAALVVGPIAAGEFTWHLKAEANSRGRIFEVAESNSALEKLVASSLLAVRRRAELLVYHAHRATPALTDSDPLASLPGVMEVTHALRSARGRLDAEKIRELFALSRADLARITGVQDETIRQTPDSERLQSVLRSFDRIARMLVLNPDRAKFATWLNAANDELDQRTPLELIKEGRSDVIETLVITGDADAVLAAKADRVAEWNKHLAA